MIFAAFVLKQLLVPRLVMFGVSISGCLIFAFLDFGLLNVRCGRCCCFFFLQSLICRFVILGFLFFDFWIKDLWVL